MIPEPTIAELDATEAEQRQCLPRWWREPDERTRHRRTLALQVLRRGSALSRVMKLGRRGEE
jgi:hypothetical protein